MDVTQIPTPALLVDMDAMESNLGRMASFFSEKEASLRPHFKNHKSPDLAKMQLRAGAIGITCATLREAEILVEDGIDNILIANEIAGEVKAAKLAELSRKASVMVAVDSHESVDDLARAQRDRQGRIQVLIDIHIGMNRCGVDSLEAALTLAKYALEQGLQVRGVMGYDGHLQGMVQDDARDELIRAGSSKLVAAAALLREHGIDASIVSTGGTGSHAVSGVFPGITEMQCGSYLLMDTHYVERFAPFTPALTVMATVISLRGERSAVIDCGLKAISGERGMSLLKDLPGVHLRALHAEHGLIEIDADSPVRLKIGQRVELWVRYSDATVNLHQRFYGIRNGQVESIFPIEH